MAWVVIKNRLHSGLGYWQNKVAGNHFVSVFYARNREKIMPFNHAYHRSLWTVWPFQIQL